MFEVKNMLNTFIIISLHIAKNTTLYPINMHICIDVNIKKLSNKYLKTKQNKKSDKMINYQEYVKSDECVQCTSEYVSGDVLKVAGLWNLLERRNSGSECW